MSVSSENRERLPSDGEVEGSIAWKARKRGSRHSKKGRYLPLKETELCPAQLTMSIQKFVQRTQLFTFRISDLHKATCFGSNSEEFGMLKVDRRDRIDTLWK